jgi:hypothetical protein
VTRHKALQVKAHRAFLLDSIQDNLLPVITERGFEAARRDKRIPTDREFELSFPLGQLYRPKQTGVDLIEIQLADYRRPAFRINAGVAPKDGMMTFTGHWPAEQICVGWLNESFEMYASPRWQTWFSLWFWRFRAPLKSDYDNLALRVASYLPEIELALREGKLGPHMRKIVIPRRPLAPKQNE